ncbi:hypothetical protein H4582DRAFT_2001264 [Lactarius indigo]|nr:hypothetical protein H4582DRAFT_2001264 [Lactarius indigo]
MRRGVRLPGAGIPSHLASGTLRTHLLASLVTTVVGLNLFYQPRYPKALRARCLAFWPPFSRTSLYSTGEHKAGTLHYGTRVR